MDRQPHAPGHWYVPGHYGDAPGHSRAKQGLQDNANAVYELAQCWRMIGDERYARVAVRLIDGCVSTVKTTSREDDSTLSFSYHFPVMIFGADLLASWPGFSSERQDPFRRFCRDKELPLNTMDRSNNWGNWGLVLVLACARYLDDGELFFHGRYRSVQASAVDAAVEWSIPVRVGPPSVSPTPRRRTAGCAPPLAKWNRRQSSSESGSSEVFPSSSHSSRSSTRRGAFKFMRRTVALPVAVKPTISPPSARKCCDQSSLRGLNNGTVSSVSGSTLTKLGPLKALHRSHAKARLSGPSSPRCCRARMCAT